VAEAGGQDGRMPSQILTEYVEGAAGQWQRAALLLDHSDFQTCSPMLIMSRFSALFYKYGMNCNYFFPPSLTLHAYPSLSSLSLLEIHKD
jgi:hypothetical protein